MFCNDINALANPTIALATIVYTIGTFLLWATSKRQLALLSEQHKSQSALAKALAKGATLDAHRQIWLPVVSDPALAALLHVSEPDKENRVACDFLGSILINHCARIFENYRANVYELSELDAFKRDARYLFSFPLVKWRWQEVAKYHSTPFNEFVHKDVTS